jgi:predicted enzyme related to lactoylglutathione lyase
MHMSTTATKLRTIGLICLPTVEQDRAIEFYESIGFEKRTDTAFGGGYRWVEVYPPEGNTGIALAPPPPGQSTEPMMTGITLTTDDIDTAHADGRSGPADVLVPRSDRPHVAGRRVAAELSAAQ